MDRKIICENSFLEIPRRCKVLLVGDQSDDFENFIYTLMGQTHLTAGSIKYRGEILYEDADSATFVLGETLRQNILMGEVYIHKRYRKVLGVVGLDISRFEGEDLIEVLENALNFSDSERRKIALARMLYVAGDIYIMNNFFGKGESTEDTQMYIRAVNNYLWDKTVVVIGNSKAIAKKVDSIIVYRN